MFDVNSILAPKVKSTSSYNRDFKLLQDWVEESLDSYKHELRQVLFPILSHCYLNLIEQNSLKQAKRLIAGCSFSQHKSQFEQLKAVTSVEHMKGSDIVQTLKSSKFEIKISVLAHKLLVSFLEDNVLSLLKLVNSHIRFKTVSHKPKPTSEQKSLPKTPIMPLGMGREEMDHLNSQEIEWGLQKEQANLERLALEKREQKERSSDEPPPKRQKLNTIESRVRVPQLTLEKRKKFFKDVKARLPATEAEPPSIASYTFVHCKTVSAMSISSCGRYVAAGCTDSRILFWDIKLLEEEKTQKTTTEKIEDRMEVDEETGERVLAKPKPKGFVKLIGHQGAVYAVDFDPENRFFLSGSEDGTALLWSVEQRALLVCYEGHNFPIWDVKFSPLGYYFATGSNDKTARVWCTDRKTPLRILAGHLSDVDRVKFHQNCNYIATGSADKTVRLWDIPTGNCVRLFAGHRGAINDLAFSNDGKLLASCGESGIMILWDIAAGKELNRFQAHDGPAWSLSFANSVLDNKSPVLASGGLEGIRLWNVEKLMAPSKDEELTALSYPTKSCVYFLAFTRTNLLLSASKLEIKKEGSSILK